MIARFSEDEAISYLNVINALWDTGISLDALRKVEEEGGNYYYVLIAGERRYRALNQLTEHACSVCSKEYGKQGCFSRHFPQGLEARVCDNIPPMEAVYRQASENTHNSLRPEEEAPYFDRMFRVARMRDAHMSLAEFARRVGKGEDKVRDALRFCSLPEAVQEMVVKRAIPYGMAVEIARLAEEKVSQGYIDYYTKLALAGNMTVGTFTRTLGRFLENHRSGTLEMFSEGLFTGIKDETEPINIKQIAEREAARSFWVCNFYLQKIAGLMSEGLLGKEDSPFSSQGPINALKSYVRTVSKLIPFMEDLLPQEQLQEIRIEFARQRLVISALDKNYSVNENTLLN